MDRGMERPDLYVVARFLERLAEAEKPPGKTELQLRVRINYSIFQRYLAWLVTKGFVTLEPDARGQEVVVMQAKGREAYASLVAWIREAVGPDRL